MKNLKKLTIILIMALIFTTIYTNSSSSAVSSDSANLTSMLNAYKKGNYKTAKKYAKKVKNTKYDASESKMTGVMTKAYANVLLNADKEYAQWGVYFADLDDDKKAEDDITHYKELYDRLIKKIEGHIFDSINVDFATKECPKILGYYTTFYQKLAMRNKDLSRIRVFTTNKSDQER